MPVPAAASITAAAMAMNFTLLPAELLLLSALALRSLLPASSKKGTAAARIRKMPTELKGGWTAAPGSLSSAVREATALLTKWKSIGKRIFRVSSMIKVRITPNSAVPRNR